MDFVHTFRVRLLLWVVVLVGMMLVVLPLLSVRAAGNIIRARVDGANSGTCGGTWATACGLQYALTTVATSGDEVWVAQGIYTPTAGTDRNISFQLRDGIALYGGFVMTETTRDQRNWATNVTTLSGDIGIQDLYDDNSYHVVNGSGVTQTAVLDGFTVTGGNGDIGGGMYSNSGSLIVCNVIFTYNQAEQGGGMYNIHSTVTLSDTTFTRNAATSVYKWDVYGGGMYNLSSTITANNTGFYTNSAKWGGGIVNSNTTISLTHVTLEANSATWGGGIANANTTIFLTHVTFEANSSSDSAGGMDNGEGTHATLSDVAFNNNRASLQGAGLFNGPRTIVILSDVIFTKNESLDGGGMYSYAVNSTLATVTFYENSAKRHCGGILNYGSLTLSNVTFSDNSAASAGGGMCTGSNTTLTNTIFISNLAYWGGGMWSFGSPTLISVTFHANAATYQGGGMYTNSTTDPGSPSLTETTFISNSAAYQGGGMYNASSNPLLAHVTFQNNTSVSGGGMYNDTSDPILTNVTFANNTSTTGGGGIRNRNSQPVLTNVTFYANTAANGGGMRNYQSAPLLRYVTFYSNVATQQGGAMYSSDFSTPTLHSSIVWGNTAFDGTQLQNVASTLTISDSVIEGGYAGGINIITADPLLGKLGDYGGATPTIPILPGSSAQDAGNPVDCPATDQRGVSRPQGAGCDLGAFEATFTMQPVYLPLIRR